MSIGRNMCFIATILNKCQCDWECPGTDLCPGGKKWKQVLWLFYDNYCLKISDSKGQLLFKNEILWYKRGEESKPSKLFFLSCLQRACCYHWGQTAFKIAQWSHDCTHHILEYQQCWNYVGEKRLLAVHISIKCKVLIRGHWLMFFLNS